MFLVQTNLLSLISFKGEFGGNQPFLASRDPKARISLIDADFTKGAITVGVNSQKKKKTEGRVVNFQLYDDVAEDRLFDRKKDNIHTQIQFLFLGQWRRGLRLLF